MRKKRRRFKDSKFIKPGNIKDYKDEDAYLRAVYKANPQIKEEGFTFKMFKMKVKNIQSEEEMKRIDTAIKALSRTRTFMSREEISFDNIKKYGDKETLKDIRKKSGWKGGIKKEDFVWNKTEQMFVHKTGSFAIRFTYADDSVSESIIEVI